MPLPLRQAIVCAKASNILCLPRLQVTKNTVATMLIGQIFKVDGIAQNAHSLLMRRETRRRVDARNVTMHTPTLVENVLLSTAILAETAAAAARASVSTTIPFQV